MSLLTLTAIRVDRLLALVTGDKIQTNSNFKAHMYHYSYVYDFIRRPGIIIPNQTTALNMARCRKAVSSVLWVQLALVVCYVLKFTMPVEKSNKLTDVFIPKMFISSYSVCFLE